MLLPLDPAWPAELLLILNGRFGKPRKIEPLAGQSRHSVWLVRFAKEKRIVKLVRGGSEADFYREVVPGSPLLASLAPALDASLDHEGVTWLVLEWIPKMLPRQRWLADSEVIAALRHLHGTDLAIPPDGWFVPSWSQEESETFL